MENQHRKITGYRELSAAEIEIMNEIKAEGVVVKALIDKLEKIQQAEYDALCMAESSESSDVGSTERKIKFDTLGDAASWRCEGARDVQVGFMKLIRSIARPTTFC